MITNGNTNTQKHGNNYHAPKTANAVNRAGIEPISTDQIFEISTQDAKNFLKAKLNAIPNRADTSLSLYTLRIADRFQPFMVLLPKTVLVNNKKNKAGNEDDEILAQFFHNNDGGGHSKKVNFAPEVFQLLKIYSYGDIFGEIEKDRSLKASLGLTRRGISDMNFIRRPHIEKLGKGGKSVELVAIAIDPILLFTDMLSVNGAKDNHMYGIQVEHITKVDSVNAIYRLRRFRKESNENTGGRSISEDIARKYSSGAYQD